MRAKTYTPVSENKSASCKSFVACHHVTFAGRDVDTPKSKRSRLIAVTEFLADAVVCADTISRVLIPGIFYHVPDSAVWVWRS
jgi:hypothetical protein